MKKFNILLSILALVVSTSVFAQETPGDSASAALVEAAATTAATYEIDAAHSTLGFAVKHMGVGKTRGAFDDYKGTVNFDPNTMTLGADVSIVAASIDTANEGRDNHLRSADFFDVEHHPDITFKNAQLKQIDGNDIIFGDLTIKGVTKTITIPVEITGPVVGMGGASLIGISGTTTINRQDFNVSFSKQLDNGGLVVDNNVELIIEIEAKAG